MASMISSIERSKSSASTEKVNRQQAQANSRNLRSLTLPRKNSSITGGLLHANHCASVMVRHALDMLCTACRSNQVCAARTSKDEVYHCHGSDSITTDPSCLLVASPQWLIE